MEAYNAANMLRTQMEAYNAALAANMMNAGGQIPLEEMCKKAADRVKDDFSRIKTRMYRYPAILNNLIRENRYFVPSAVAIGPYHHQIPYLQKAQEIKRAAAHLFCKDLDLLPNEIFKNFQPVAAGARSCYVAVAGNVAGNEDLVIAGFNGMSITINVADFEAMMFCDGCFLLQFIMWRTNGGGEVDPSLKIWFESNQGSILKDIFMMENQIPWSVLEALMAVRPVPINDFISQAGISFEARVDSSKNKSSHGYFDTSSYKPAHLLGLLWYYQTGSHDQSRKSMDGASSGPERVKSAVPPQSSSSSAIELAEIGIKVVASETTWFKDIGLKKGRISGKLSLPPMVMNDRTACWLVNMVTLEACSATAGTSDEQYSVSSYVLLLTMLMNREEDVHELRVKSILHGDLGDQRTLSYFKILAEFIHHPVQHTLLLADLDAYKRNRWLRTALHKFVYNNFKTIVTVFSIVGVLVGIFKSLLSIKQNQH